MKNIKVKLLGIIFLFLLIIIPTNTNAEDIVVDKIEIEGVNYNLTVGEEPELNAHLVNYADEIILDEFFMSKNRESVIDMDEESSDPDRLIKDYIYFHIINLDIKENAGIKFDSNTKFYINGELAKVSYISESGCSAVIDSEEDTITPNGYVASNYLDDEFVKKQEAEAQEIILKDIIAGKVIYDSDETLAIIEDALANNKEISIELCVSESMTKSQTYNYYTDFHYDKLEESVNENQKIGAYYTVDILVYVDGYLEGSILSFETPISVTIPYPNGLPNIDSKYDRLWKIYRYHEGEITEINGTRTENGINFMSNKFSSYLAAYELVEKEEPIEENINNPKTGDNLLLFISLLVLSSTSIIILRKNTNN